jgi:hypothetical protein
MVPFCPLLPDICNSIALFGSYQVLFANPSDWDSLKMKDKHEALAE